MAKMITTGFDQLIKEFEDIADHSQEICSKSVYEGAGMMADKLKQSINSINEEGQRKHRSRSLLPYEKEALQNGLSISKFKKDAQRDVVQTTISFKGYVHHPTEAFPDGMPLIYLARSINRGTTFRTPNRYFPNTVNRNAKAVEQKMVEVTEAEIKKYIK